MSGHQGFQSRTGTRKRNKLKHKKMGLCVYCSQKAVEGQVYCEKHREYHREYYRKRS